MRNCNVHVVYSSIATNQTRVDRAQPHRFKEKKNYVLATLHCFHFMPFYHTMTFCCRMKVCFNHKQFLTIAVISKRPDHLYYYRRAVFKIRGISSRAGAIRQRSRRRFFCAYMLPIPDLCAAAFCVLLSVVFYEKKKIMRHYISCRASTQFSR